MHFPSLSSGCEIAQFFVRHTGRAARGHDDPANVVNQVTESPPPQLGFRGRLGNDSTQNGPGHLNGHCPFARLRTAWNGCFNHNPSRGRFRKLDSESTPSFGGDFRGHSSALDGL